METLEILEAEDRSRVDCIIKKMDLLDMNCVAHIHINILISKLLFFTSKEEMKN